MGYGKHVKKILYGGDYNPEQWPEEVWQEDMRMMKKAHINMVTLNVFSWAALRPDEDTYDFAKLDKIMELVRRTACRPVWQLLQGRIRLGWRSVIRIFCGQRTTA